MPFIPLTPAERDAMLERIGAPDSDALFEAIPTAVRYPHLDLPAGESELQVSRALRKLAAANQPATEVACFLGAGVYNHFIPAAVGALVSRGEFLTAYTPY